jgi:hypothetical protein
VLPGTHSQGVLSDEDIDRLAHTVTPVDRVAQSGGVIAMRPLIVHASSKVATEILDGCCTLNTQQMFIMAPVSSWPLARAFCISV